LAILELNSIRMTVLIASIQQLQQLIYKYNYKITDITTASWVPGHLQVLTLVNCTKMWISGFHAVWLS